MKILSHPLKSEDEEEFEDEEAVELLSGGASSESSGGAGDLLLELIAMVSRLHVLLDEMPPEEHKLTAARLVLFKKLVSSLPKKARARRAIGFNLPSL